MRQSPNTQDKMEIEIEFISSKVLESKSKGRKINYILNRIKKDKILVFERSLSSFDESKLIEETMKQIDEKFSGIEISTLKESNIDGVREKLIRILGGNPGGLTVIGPSKLVKKIKKEPERISLFAEFKDSRTRKK
ncbi:MAG: hypothetical protein B6U97_00955 [Candidatus Altiarchaeales archaeon ex4484_96]|nr:MAG: hypothetical protein B6U97_00955 [Candidatus Altiarchaeales archaeon ex4484_96]